MLDKNNEVFFGEYCKTCKYKNYSETDCPCSECIAEPVNLYSHKPIRWEGSDGVFSGPPPRPDHAYQRAVKYVPERRKDKEKAIARLNIDAEYTGNKVQSISDGITDDQYPSATAVKKALESKIDAPQVARVGEVLTVEEVDADGKPKKWKTQTVETKAPDWDENEPTKSGYIENRTHYKYSDEFLGEIAFTATSKKELIMEDPNSTENHGVIDAIGRTALTEHNTTKIIIDGEVCISNAFFSRYVTSLDGEFNYGAGGPAGYQYPAVVNNDGIVLVPGKVYVIQFYNVGEYYKPLSEKYLPNTIFSQSNAPVKFGSDDDGNINYNSSVQGDYTKASGSSSHAEGSYTEASGSSSHAEGSYAKASGNSSHAEGHYTEAKAEHSHAEGIFTVASTYSQQVSGRYNIPEDQYREKITKNKTIWISNYSTVFYRSNAWTFNTKTGKYSLIDPEKCSFSEVTTGMYYIINNDNSDISMYYLTSLKSASSSSKTYNCILYSVVDQEREYGTYAHIVGNGTSSELSNAYTLDWEGNAWFAGDVYVHSTSGTNKDEGSVRLATEDLLTSCVRLLIRSKKNNDGTITYSTNFPALFVYYEIFKGRPIDDGNSIECCLLTPTGNKNLTVLNYTGMSVDQNSDGNIVLTIRFSSYVSDKQISAEIKDTISGLGTDDEKILSTVVTVTENALVSCSITQELTREQQELAKRNIGAGTLRKVYYWDATNDTPENPNSVMRYAEYGDTCICLNQTMLPHGMVGPVLVIYGEISYGRRSATAFDGSNATWTFSVNLSDHSYSTPIKKSGIPTPTTAQVGQIVKVKAVDADGKITETEAVDMPSVSSDYELVFQETVAEDAIMYSRDTDKDGNPFSLTDVMVIIFTKPFAESTNSNGRGLGFLPTSRWGKDCVSCNIGSSISSANTNSVGRYNVVFVKVVNGYQVVTRAYESQNTTNVFGVLVRQTKAGNEMFEFHNDATKLMQIASPQGNITCVKIVGYTNPLVSAGTIVALYKKKGT